MSRPTQKSDSTRRRRRYLLHLFCTHNEGSGACHYMARIQPWTARISTCAEIHEHVFMDEYELIETINRLLPSGSDVRDVFSDIESSEGFFYILHLNSEEAECLGWRS